MSFRQEIRTLLKIVPLLVAVSCSGAHPKTTAPAVDEALRGGIEPESAEVQAEQPLPSLEELQQLAATDPEQALIQMDRRLAATPEDGPLLVLFGNTTLALFQRKQDAGQLGPGLAADLLADAKEAFSLAQKRDTEKAQAEAGFVRCQLLAGEVDAAWQTALQLFATITPALEQGEEVDSSLLLSVGKAGLAAASQAKQAQQPEPASIHLATTSLETAWQQGEFSAALPLADLWSWLGQQERAAKTLVRALQLQPNNLQLYQRLQNIGPSVRNLQVDLLTELCQQHPGQAMPLWYLGEALYLQGRAARDAADTLKALACWDLAEDTFQQAMALEPAYANTCEEWLFYVRTQRGWTLRDEGRIDDAAATFVSVLESAPERLEPNPDAQSLHLGIDAITADYYRQGNLKEARQFLRKVCAIYDGNSDWTNNLGFFCRDLGTEALAAGNEELAQQLFQESWDAYSRSVELAPDDARIVNDRALIAVYYLEEHLDLAEQELHRAIELGEQSLSQMGPDVPQSEHEYYDMAVGDAWENLAYLYLNRYQEIGDAETYIQNSLKHFPFNQRGGIPPLRKKLEELRKRNP